MDLSDPVDAAALLMFNEARAFLIALEAGLDPDPITMVEATNKYADAVDASLHAACQHPSSLGDANLRDESGHS